MSSVFRVYDEAERNVKRSNASLTAICYETLNFLLCFDFFIGREFASYVVFSFYLHS